MFYVKKWTQRLATLKFVWVEVCKVHFHMFPAPLSSILNLVCHKSLYFRAEQVCRFWLSGTVVGIDFCVLSPCVNPRVLR